MTVRSLSPAEMYPASATGVSATMVSLRTGVRVRALSSGPPTGPVVLMLHGWGASAYSFRHGLELLPKRGLRTIAVDLRGFGLSDHPSERGAYSLAAYLADLDALVEQLRLDRFALIGHSMGGGLSLHYALEHVDRLIALALVNPTELVAIPALFAMRIVPRPVVEGIGERLVPRWLVKLILEHVAFGDASRVTERDVDEYWAPTQIPGFMRAIRRTVAQFDWRPLSNTQAASLAVSTAVVLGTKDRLVRHARAAALRLSGGEVHELAGGHCVHEERPDEVYGLLGAFIERRATE
jgi:pimeloyl-ACP methyl ester carboxylesterase